MVIKEVAGNVVNGLTASPVLLIVLALNLCLVGGMGYFLLEFGKANSARVNMILESCLPKP